MLNPFLESGLRSELNRASYRLLQVLKLHLPGSTTCPVDKGS